MEDLIALHEVGNYSLGRVVDLMFGGGICHFLPNSTYPSCRRDNIDVFKIAESIGWNIKTGLESFRALDVENAPLPLMNLFAADHMNFEIDRNPAEQPHLKEMTAKALDILSHATKNSDKGFFIMIEGSRIDMAAHNNDPAAHVRDIFAYQETIEYVKSFVASRDDTVMISVSDHETGGLSVAVQLNETYPVYMW